MDKEQELQEIVEILMQNKNLEASVDVLRWIGILIY